MGEVHVAILQGMVRVPGRGGAAAGSFGMTWCGLRFGDMCSVQGDAGRADARFT